MSSSGDSDAPHILKLRMLHSIGGGAFTQRGDVTLNYNPSRSAAGKAIQFSPEQKLSKKELKALLASNSPATLYRVKFVAENQKEEDAVTAALPLCSLITSHFHESFLFHADPYGSLLGVNYRSPLSTCASPAELLDIVSHISSSDATMQPKGKVSFGRPGEKAKLHVRPGFDAASQAAAQAVGSEVPVASATPSPQAAPERAADGSIVAPVAPKSFWEKYWLYILPVGVFVVLQAVLAPPEQGGAPAAGGGAK